MPPVLKKILSMVLLVITCFGAVIGIISWEMGSVARNVKTAGDLQIPMYRAAVMVKQESSELENLVAKAFLAQSSTDFEQLRRNADKVMANLSATIRTLRSAEFQPLHGHVLAPTATNGAPAEARQETTGNVGQLLARLSTNSFRLNEAVERTFALAEEQLVSRKALAAARDELSKTYRAGVSLIRASEPGYQNLSRAVMTVLYSSSTRDLNFVGRSKFKEAEEVFSKAGLAAEQKAKLDAITVQFGKTFALAAAASASKADFGFFTTRMNDLVADVSRLREFAEHEFQEVQTVVASTTASTVKRSVVLSVIAVFLGIGMAYMLSRSITRKIASVASALRQGARRVASAAGQMQSSSAVLSEGATSQAASLEETSASLCEMASMTKQTSSNAQRAKDLSADTRSTAEGGAANVRDMEEAMNAIKESSDSIVKIVKLIDELAFQTNILALNAAVEAARAGNAGLGFAVVANEVRNLAQMSASAAQETSMKIQDSIERSERGVRISSAVALSLEAIKSKAKSMDELIAEIACAAVEQHNGIGLINSAVRQIDEITQTSAETAEEAADAANDLKGQASELMRSVDALVSLVGEGRTERRGGAGIAAPSRVLTANGTPASRQVLVIPKGAAASSAVSEGAAEPVGVDAGQALPNAFKNF